MKLFFIALFSLFSVNVFAQDSCSSWVKSQMAQTSNTNGFQSFYEDYSGTVKTRPATSDELCGLVRTASLCVTGNDDRAIAFYSELLNHLPQHHDASLNVRTKTGFLLRAKIGAPRAPVTESSQNCGTSENPLPCAEQPACQKIEAGEGPVYSCPNSGVSEKPVQRMGLYFIRHC